MNIALEPASNSLTLLIKIYIRYAMFLGDGRLGLGCTIVKVVILLTP